MNDEDTLYETAGAIAPLGACVRRLAARTVAAVALLALAACARPYVVASSPNDRFEPTIAMQLVGFGEPTSELQPGLCLSGGGYRAMLFHAGVLLRLYERGDLPRYRTISSVSGGSITAAQLAIAWSKLNVGAEAADRDAFIAEVVDPLRRLAGHTIQYRAAIAGLVAGNPSITVAEDLDEYLGWNSKLEDLPRHPVFLINTTNILTGSRWGFTRGFIFGFEHPLPDAGRVVLTKPDLPLSVAVAASASYVPFLAPARFDLSKLEQWRFGTGSTGNYATYINDATNILSGYRFRPEYSRANIPLVDGGVGGNLGREFCTSVGGASLISDATRLDPPVASISNNWLSTFRRSQTIVWGRAEGAAKNDAMEVNSARYQLSMKPQQVRDAVANEPHFVALSYGQLTGGFRMGVALLYGAVNEGAVLCMDDPPTPKHRTSLLTRQALWDFLGDPSFAAPVRTCDPAGWQDVDRAAKVLMAGMDACWRLVTKPEAEQKRDPAWAACETRIHAAEAALQWQEYAMVLASIETEFAKIDREVQEHIINWGYLSAELVLLQRENWSVLRDGGMVNDWSLLAGRPFELPYALHPDLRSACYAELLRTKSAVPCASPGFGASSAGEGNSAGTGR